MKTNTDNTPAGGKASARDVILDTAERLFAEQGIEAVSLRAINTEAGYSVAALHYHFGTRERLIDALIERRQGPILERRKVLLDALESEEKPDIYAVTEALVLPMAEPIFADPERGLRTIKFFFQTYMDQANHQRVRRVIEESYRIFDRLLARALPHLDKRLLHQRWVLAAELTFQGLANIDSIITRRRYRKPESNYRHYTTQLVDFIAGGLAVEERSSSKNKG